MNYTETIEWLEELANPERTGLDRSFKDRMTLEPTLRLMELLGNPHNRLHAVHIAGTKGKGSVAAMVEAAARSAGHRTGLFTSPHLISWRERIRIDGRCAGEASIAAAASRVRPAVEAVEDEGPTPPSFFEACTAMAFLIFADATLDLCVLETGLGGRLDATNVITPLVSIITTLGMDHAEILGNTVEEIAGEKAGIIKPRVPVVVAPGAESVITVLRDRAQQVGAELTVAEPFNVHPVHPISAEHVEADQVPVPVEVLSGRINGEATAVRLPLPGTHQATNIGVAAEACGTLTRLGQVEISPDEFRRGLEALRWPARVQLVEARPWLVVDCAHNGESARALMSALRRHLQYDRLLVVIGLSCDKPVQAIAAELPADLAIITQASIARAMPAEAVAVHGSRYWKRIEVIESPALALSRARELAGPRDLICVTGSFFIIDDLASEGHLKIGICDR